MNEKRDDRGGKETVKQVEFRPRFCKPAETVTDIEGDGRREQNEDEYSTQCDIHGVDGLRYEEETLRSLTLMVFPSTSIEMIPFLERESP